MTHNITHIEDILTIKGLWYERELDSDTGLYEFTGAVYLSIPEKDIVVNCSDGNKYDRAFLKECDELAKKNVDTFSRPKYIYINMYEIRQLS